MRNPFKRDQEKRLAKKIEKIRREQAITAMFGSERDRHPEQCTCKGYKLILVKKERLTNGL